MSEPTPPTVGLVGAMTAVVVALWKALSAAHAGQLAAAKAEAAHAQRERERDAERYEATIRRLGDKLDARELQLEEERIKTLAAVYSGRSVPDVENDFEPSLPTKVRQMLAAVSKRGPADDLLAHADTHPVEVWTPTPPRR